MLREKLFIQELKPVKTTGLVGKVPGTNSSPKLDNDDGSTHLTDSCYIYSNWFITMVQNISEPWFRDVMNFWLNRSLQERILGSTHQSMDDSLPAAVAYPMCCGTGWVSNHTGNLQGILWADFQAPLKLSTRTISREHLLQGVFPSNWLPSSQTPQKNGLLLDLFIFGYHFLGVLPIRLIEQGSWAGQHDQASFRIRQFSHSQSVQAQFWLGRPHGTKDTGFLVFPLLTSPVGANHQHFIAWSSTRRVGKWSKFLLIKSEPIRNLLARFDSILINQWFYKRIQFTQVSSSSFSSGCRSTDAEGGPASGWTWNQWPSDLHGGSAIGGS